MIGVETAPEVTAEPRCRVLQGDALTRVRELPPETIHCIVTSPPYWGLRDYQGPHLDFSAGSYSPMPGLPPVDYPAWRGQLGLEPDPVMFIGHLVEIFRELHRVLRRDGTCWVNMGDCHTSKGGHCDTKYSDRRREYRIATAPDHVVRPMRARGAKPKDMIGQPWRLAFALQADGWYLRQDIIWAKPNPMPESVRDRCTKAHEFLFLLTKSPRYFFDATAIKEPVSGTAHPRGSGLYRKITPAGWMTGAGAHSAIAHNTPARRKVFGKNSRVRVNRDADHQAEAQVRAKQNRSFSAAVCGLVTHRNKRDVWLVAPRAYRGAHFATFPPALVEPCILAGCPRGGVALDPFGGSGTVAEVALKHGRRAVLVELNPAYHPLIAERLAKAEA
ncbi:MAG: site-specific DNA-methyltransferase [Verrucomicrobia bacterium]|nr:site-specific DNA-methyltransferase [Verrucomicrobiota bacterium]